MHSNSQYSCTTHMKEHEDYFVNHILTYGFAREPTCIPTLECIFTLRDENIPMFRSPKQRSGNVERNFPLISTRADRRGQASSVRRAYKSMTAAASSEEPTHAVQVPPLRPREPPLRPPPPPPPTTRPPLPPRLASATSARLAAAQTTSRSAYCGRTPRLIIFFFFFF